MVLSKEQKLIFGASVVDGIGAAKRHRISARATQVAYASSVFDFPLIAPLQVFSNSA